MAEICYTNTPFGGATVAAILYLRDQTRRRLGGRTLIGRSPAAAIMLIDGKVSGEHAVITWHGPDGWAVQDLGSRNGTWVNGERLGSGDRIRLAAGDELRVAGERHVFRVVDVDPPVPGAEGEDGRFVEAADGVLLLPNNEDPEVLIFEDSDGRWFSEIEELRASVKDGAVIPAGGQRWRLVLPDVQAYTEDAGRLDPLGADLALSFAVSADEEHVEITVVLGGERIAIPPRSHAYVLLTLARERLRDQADGVPDDEQGWVYREELAKMVGSSGNALNVALFRARQQLAAERIRGAGDLIEVRALSHKLRIGVSDLTVLRP